MKRVLLACLVALAALAAVARAEAPIGQVLEHSMDEWKKVLAVQADIDAGRLHPSEQLKAALADAAKKAAAMHQHVDELHAFTPSGMAEKADANAATAASALEHAKHLEAEVCRVFYSKNDLFLHNIRIENVEQFSSSSSSSFSRRCSRIAR